MDGGERGKAIEVVDQQSENASVGGLSPLSQRRSLDKSNYPVIARSLLDQGGKWGAIFSAYPGSCIHRVIRAGEGEGMTATAKNYFEQFVCISSLKLLTGVFKPVSYLKTLNRNLYSRTREKNFRVAWSGLVLSVFIQTTIADDTLVLLGGTIIDGTGREPIHDGAVVVQDRRIVAVGSIADVIIPAESTRISVEGKTVLPGFIDSHIHNGFTPELRRSYLTHGVTSICDVGSPMTRISEFEIYETPDGPIARGFRSGPILTAIGGLPDAVLHEDLNLEIGTTDQAREAVEELSRAGADFLKLYLHSTVNDQNYPVLDQELVVAIVKEAHARGMIVRAHVTDLQLLHVAINSGVDIIDHLPKPPISTWNFVKNFIVTFDLDKAILRMISVDEHDELFARMVEDEIVMVPTLVAGFGQYIEDETDAGRKAMAKAVVETLGRYHALGGRIGLGTDMNPGTRGEAAIPLDELRLLTLAGMTPMEAISAATQNAAYACGHERDLGTLEVGKLADIIVVEGDPLLSLEALSNLHLVIKDGIPIH